MASTDLPSASVSVNAQATASGAGDGYIAVITPTGVAAYDDGVPRLFASGKAAFAVYGYSPGLSYAALHAEKTRKPFLVVGIPVATAGAASAVSATAMGGTSTVTVTEGAAGTLTNMDATLTVVTGGTIGTAGIVLSLTIDGGAVTKTIRLGTANTYVIPDVGLTINFAAGTLIAGATYTWTATAPMWDSDGIALARTGLAAANYAVRTWLVDGEENMTPTLAGHIATQAASYASSNKRFIMARAGTEGLSEASWALEAAAQSAAYTAINSTDGRLSLGFGRRRILCPLTGWAFERSSAWAASLREYDPRFDLHNTTWWRRRGSLENDGWYALSTDVVHDERVDGGALAGRFTCFTTLDNKSGTYIAKDLTRASSDSVLFLPNNVQVTNAACTIAQAMLEDVIGQDLIKQSDGTIDPNQATDIEETINTALARELRRTKVAGRGPRASSVRFTLSRDDDLTGADATLTGYIELNLRGVVSKASVEVRVF